MDLDRDEVLRANEHRRRESAQAWCPLVGEISVLPGKDGVTLLILAARYERWNRSLTLLSHTRVVQVAPLLTAA